MLHERYGWTIQSLLLPQDQFHPFGRRCDRQAWTALNHDVRNKLVESGEKAMREPWPALPATLYLDYAREGNRSRYEAPYLTRRSILARLVLAECVEAGGRFIDAIADALWSICEESTWCLPAHTYLQKAGNTLSETTEPIVDLFAADTGSLVSWTWYLMGEALDPVSPVLRPRLVREVRTRVIHPCLERDDFWWMGLHGQSINNWNPWICSNWLACLLLTEANPVRRAQAATKVLRCLDVFLASYGPDGGCDEGPGYWARAGASLFDCLELLHWGSNGRINVYDQPLVANIGRFIYRAQLADRWFVNFADAAALMTPPASLLWRFGRRIGDEAMSQLGSYFLAAAEPVATDLTRALPAISLASEMADTPSSQPLPRDVWLADIQVMVTRSADGSTRGLTLAAKGGHNAESHNHNDVGHFIVFSNGAPLLIDIGVETYTLKTFSPQRYEIWTMQSAYHNLPMINGCQQLDGRNFAARDVRHRADDMSAALSLDIAGAYGPQAGVASWKRTMELCRGDNVRIKDQWKLSGPARELTWALMTPCMASLEPGRVVLSAEPLSATTQSGAGVVQFDAAAMEVSVEPIVIQDGNLRRVWGEQVCRIMLRARKPAPAGETMIEIRN